MLQTPLTACVSGARFRYTLHILLCLALISTPKTSLANDNLPNIGDPASTALSPAKEIELGRILLAEIRKRLPVSNDPELNQYMHSLGTRITSGGLNSNSPFTFLLVFDASINAFALPGGVIVVNSGLLTLAQRESELASVLAHEIAHVTQRHIARNFANEKSLSVISALTLLGSILAAAYGGKFGQAAIITSQAGIQQTRLGYSRSFEQEADRIGMHLLVSANIDPQGMPLLFERLNEYTQLNRDQIPEFLSSHPPTSDRISESKAQASQYKGAYTRNTILFDYARARTIALSLNPAKIIEDFRKKIRLSKKLGDTDNYTYALALKRTGKNKQAIQQLLEIPINAENELTIKLAIAQAHIAAGQANQARISLMHLEQLYPNNVPLVYYLATSLIEEKQARLALQKLDQLNTMSQQNPAIDKLKAEAASKANMPWRSHESLGDFYIAHGQYKEAMEQIQLSLKSPGIDLNTRARVKFKKAQLQEFLDRREDFK